MMVLVGVRKAFRAPSNKDLHLPPDEDPLVPIDSRARLGHMAAGAPSSMMEDGEPTEEMPVNDPRQDMPSKTGVTGVRDLSHEDAMALDEEDRQKNIARAKLRQVREKFRAQQLASDRIRGFKQKKKKTQDVWRPADPLTGVNPSRPTPRGTLSMNQVGVLDNLRRRLVGVGPKSTPGETWRSDMVDHFPGDPLELDPAEEFEQQFDALREAVSLDIPEKRGRSYGKDRYKKTINDMKAFRKKWFLPKDNKEGPPTEEYPDGSPLPEGWHPDTPWERSRDWYRPIAGGKQNEGRSMVGVRGPQTKRELQPKPKPEPEPEPEGPSWKDKFLAGGKNLFDLRGAEDPHPYPELILGMGEHGLGHNKPDHRKLMQIQNKKEEMYGRPPLHDMSMFDEHDKEKEAIKLEHALKRARTTDKKVLDTYRDNEQKALFKHGLKLPKPPESLTSQKLWQDILDWHGRTEAARREAGEEDIDPFKKSYLVGVRRRLVGVV